MDLLGEEQLFLWPLPDLQRQIHHHTSSIIVVLAPALAFSLKFEFAANFARLTSEAEASTLLCSVLAVALP